MKMRKTTLLRTLAITPVIAFATLSTSIAFASNDAMDVPKKEIRNHQKSGIGNLGKVFLFDRLDINEDNLIDSEEFLQRASKKANRRFIHRDQNEDEQLDFEEFTIRHKDSVPSENVDEVRSCIENATGTSLLTPEERFSNADTDNNELLTLDEFTQAILDRSESRFITIDQDSSNFLDLEEFEQAIDARKAHKLIVKSCLDAVSSEDVL